jgi:hypothetical protein
MSEDRARLLRLLEERYRCAGWAVNRASDGTLVASGPGGVSWVAAAIVPGDLESDELERRLADLSARRMPGGELCPLDLLADPACDGALRALLKRMRLADQPHVSVYSLAA